MKYKSKIIIFLSVLLMLCIIPSLYFARSEYFQEDYWEWHTRTTTTDMAYNGKHIIFTDNRIDFYGYGVTSYKDYLYKEYENPGERTFKFQLDESRASYHTLDGAGFIFNAKEDAGKLSGDVLVINQNKIVIYRLDNVNINALETTSNKTLADYATSILATVNKPRTAIHQFEIKTSPTNVTVKDNGAEVINLALDYSTHAGEGFGLIVSYLQHSCNILTQIEFAEFQLTVKDYVIPVLKTDKDEHPLKKATFEIVNSDNEVVAAEETGEDGKIEVKGLIPGTYKVREKIAPTGYILKTDEIEFVYTGNGKILDPDTNEEITLHFSDERMKVLVTKYTKDTNDPIPDVKVGLCDEDGNIIDDEAVGKTDSNGQIDLGSTNLLAPGKYYYKDISTISGYKIDDKIHYFTVDEYGNVTYSENEGIIYNSRVKVTIKKLEKDTQKPISGIKIALCDEEGNIVKDDNGEDIVLTTDDNGDIKLGEDDIMPSGTYYYKEISTKRGYQADDTVYSFTVKEDGSVEYSQKDGIHYVEKTPGYEEVIIETNKKEQPNALPKAGKGIIEILILALAASAGIGYIKYRKYNI